MLSRFHSRWRWWWSRRRIRARWSRALDLSGASRTLRSMSTARQLASEFDEQADGARTRLQSGDRMRGGMTGAGGDLAQFEGLVCRTSRLFAGRVGLEEEDLQQILRVKVWQAVNSYKTSRATQTLKAYVFSCVTNKVKDLKRDAARRAQFPAPCYIEDAGPADMFDARYLAEDQEQAFAAVEDEFDLPSSLTQPERRVVILLALGFAQIEIAAILELRRPEVKEIRERVEEKMADWRPPVAAAQHTEVPIAA